MTSLESFLKIIPEEIELLSGYQQSPSDLYLAYSSEDFFKIIEFFSADKILFRFSEIKPNNILIVHLIFYNLPEKINVTFELTDHDERVLKELKTKFPACEAVL